MFYKESIRNLVDFYKTLSKVDLAQDSFSKATINNGYLPVKKFRVVDVIGWEDKLPLTIQFLIKNVFESYILPYGDFQSIRGFIFRSVKDKAYRVFSDEGPYFYGFHHFKNFKFGDPVILVEGVKEVEAVYSCVKIPSLATLSARITTKQLEVLKRLSDNSVWIGDNDLWGHKNLKYNRNKVRVAITPNRFKDLGEYFETQSKSEVELFLNQVVSLFKY